MGSTLSYQRPQTSPIPFQLTIADIILVKEHFSKISRPLPVELIDQILDDASYWPHSSVTLEWDMLTPGNAEVQDGMYMRTLPFAVYGTEGNITLTQEHVEHYPCRKIVFQLWSQDQGWSDDRDNHGTYRGSYTWYDASVETLDPHLLVCESDSPILVQSPFHFTRRDPEHPFLPPPTHLQRNVHAKRTIHHHTITWHYLDSIESPAAMKADLNGRGWKSLDGSFVRSLKVSDCITLWVRARFPGWSSHIVKAKIETYWAV
ncbi:hypothetical protein PILCRDRAFT_69475 [Piloderma croceum F 1598]|uniref:Uncharacterized protein n=1 Tax=Piloderma croceum (strain F 1598) TaxID=765440 RepID=A0A0C3FG94_PILCF|nr:hypothetical protein PILCRDRAFT_69475 [Piloderma croceum F 1598]